MSLRLASRLKPFPSPNKISSSSGSSLNLDLFCTFSLIENISQTELLQRLRSLRLSAAECHRERRVTFLWAVSLRSCRSAAWPRPCSWWEAERSLRCTLSSCEEAWSTRSCTNRRLTGGYANFSLLLRGTSKVLEITWSLIYSSRKVFCFFVRDALSRHLSKCLNECNRDGFRRLKNS